MKTNNQFGSNGPIFKAVKSLPLLLSLFVANPEARAVGDTSVTPGTNDGDFSFVVSGTNGFGQLTRHIFKGNIKRFTKGVAIGLNDPLGTATFISNTNSATRTNFWVNVSPNDGYVAYGNVDNIIPIGGYVSPTNDIPDYKITTGLKTIATVQYPPTDGIIDGSYTTADGAPEGTPTSSQVYIVCKNPPVIKMAIANNKTLSITCPTNTTFPFDTLYSSPKLGLKATWTTVPIKPSKVGANLLWTNLPMISKNGSNLFYKVATW